MVAFVFCVLIGACLAVRADGQDAMSDETALMRLCASEATWRTDMGDCDGIHAVLAFRRDHLPAYRGDSIARAAVRYSGRRLTRGQMSRPWVVRLTPSCARPAGWYRHLPWAGTHQHGCERLRERVREILRGDRGWVIVGPVHDWGAPSISDSYRARNPDARPARLSARTLNDFWELTRYTTAFGG